MAEKAVVHSYDWNHDFEEMINASTVYPNPLMLSNHSYGPEGGWNDAGDIWYGNPSSYSDSRFGDNDTLCQALDGILRDAPYYVVVWAAGNDRGSGAEPGVAHKHYGSGNQQFTDTHEKDGGDYGYDCIIGVGLSKNVITVGAVDDIENGYLDSSNVKQVNTFFSSSGPTDDGRIKPDIVANGDDLYSTVYRVGSDSGSYFYYKQGTSMAAPNVTGSIALLQEYYQNTHNQNYPKAATIKALIIHAADEAGSNPGPDFKFGWGLLNTERAAEIISKDESSANTIQELTLSNSQSYSLEIFNDGTIPIKVTIAWTDPAPSNLMSSKMLVRDLDIRLSNGNNFYPWVLNSGQPFSPATQGDNIKDNVEQVFLQNPTAGYYTINVTHKGTLTSPQNFSMIISGDVSPEATINISQIDINNTAFGQAAYWNGSAWNYVSPTQPVTLDIADQYFLASQEFKTGTTQKYNYWQNNIGERNYINFASMNITSQINAIEAQFTNASSATVQNVLEGFTNASGGTIMFSDPWLVDESDPQKGYYNRGINAILKSAVSPLSLSIGGSYKGVFLNQNPQFQQGLPNYAVKTTSPQDIYLSQTGKTHKFYFQNWSGTNINYQNSNNLESAVVFTSSGSTANAVLKGTQLSNNTNAYKNGSQQKFIKVPYSDYIVSVYESMDKIWLEGSTDNGSTWQILNDNSPINGNTVAKNPSLAVVGDLQFAVVYQEDSGSGSDRYKVKIKVFALCCPSFNQEYEGVVDVLDGFYDANPVLAVQDVVSSTTNLYMIVWDENYINGFSNPGLHYRLLERNSSGNLNFVGYPVKISNTDANSLNPTITTKHLGSDFHIAWEQQANSYNYEIRYIKAARSGSSSISFNSYSIPSSGSGLTWNTAPSITVTENNYVRVAWIGQPFSGGPTSKKAVIRFRSTSSWYTTIYQYGTNVQNVSMNTTQYSDKWGCAWVEGNGTSNKYLSSWYSGIHTLNTNGNYVQVNNGDGDVNNMRAMAFYTNTSPYNFNLSDRFSNLSKSLNITEYEGRTGIVTLQNTKKEDSKEYYYSISEVMLNNKPIKFEPLSDTLMIKNIKELNYYITTEPFDLNSLSELTYNMEYGICIRDSEETVMKENENIKFRVELVNADNYKTLYMLDDIKFDKNTKKTDDNKNCLVNLKEIGNTKARLRLVVEDNAKGEYTISNILYDSKENLTKESYENITIKGNGIPEQYYLSQNYPNPFNPTTTINYQLPKDEHVTLKIYDMLGKEITILVNEFKTSGNYNITFDGSDLSSGVNFYKIEAGNFSDTKKLILMK